MFLDLPRECALRLFRVITLAFQVMVYTPKHHSLYLFTYPFVDIEVLSGAEGDRIFWVQVIHKTFLYRALYLFHARHNAT